jgi:tripartite-type tricarboxylate transporter receptor subunit TctC
MQFTPLRRALLATAVGLALAPSLLHAQAWPAKPIRLIVPAAPGSAPDVVARMLADRLGTSLGQTLIVDNRPGAGGIPGMSALARSANDGYTIGFAPAAMATITPLVYKNPQFNPDTDFQPIATVGTSPLVLVTLAGNGINSLADLAKVAKASPGKVNFAAPQPNSLPHLAGEMVSKAGDMGLFTVPYPGPPAR